MKIKKEKEKNATRTSVGRKKTNAAKVIVLDRKTERKKQGETERGDNSPGSSLMTLIAASSPVFTLRAWRGR